MSVHESRNDGRSHFGEFVRALGCSFLCRQPGVKTHQKAREYGPKPAEFGVVRDFRPLRTSSIFLFCSSRASAIHSQLPRFLALHQYPAKILNPENLVEIVLSDFSLYFTVAKAII